MRPRARYARVVCGRRCGQASVEAAFLAPVALACMLLLVQPGIVLYDRAVMMAAASEACRLLETRSVQSDEEIRAFVERRLAAVPDTEAFHAGSWDIEFEGSQEAGTVSVRIAHGLKPLPLIGTAMGFASMLDGGGSYRHEVTCEAQVKDEWLLDSEHGADPEAWIDRWNDKV